MEQAPYPRSIEIDRSQSCGPPYRANLGEHVDWPGGTRQRVIPCQDGEYIFWHFLPSIYWQWVLIYKSPDDEPLVSTILDGAVSPGLLWRFRNRIRMTDVYRSMTRWLAFKHGCVFPEIAVTDLACCGFTRESCRCPEDQPFCNYRMHRVGSCPYSLPYRADIIDQRVTVSPTGKYWIWHYAAESQAVCDFVCVYQTKDDTPMIYTAWDDTAWDNVKVLRGPARPWSERDLV